VADPTDTITTTTLPQVSEHITLQRCGSDLKSGRSCKITVAAVGIQSSRTPHTHTDTRQNKAAQWDGPPARNIWLAGKKPPLALGRPRTFRGGMLPTGVASTRSLPRVNVRRAAPRASSLPYTCTTQTAGGAN
jgi:hypothetical protein